MTHIHYSDYVPPQDDPKRPFPGEGEVDFKACTATIARHRYSGLICIEGSKGQRETLEERLRQTVKYLKAVAEEVGG